MVNSRKNGSVMVVGGGIAGIQSSLDLADSGYKVYLVESSTAIGGRMAQLDKTFPTNDCAMCTISPRLVAAGTHRNIEIITNADLTKLDGQAGNFNATVTVNANFVDQEKCTGCGDCAQSCPVTVDDDYNQGLAARKAIFKMYPQAVPNKYSMSRLGVAPCYDACPIHGNPSGYVALAAEGKFQEAYESATEKNPFPSICGRICEHPCEQECNRDNLDTPVSIAYIKRYLADWNVDSGVKVTVEEKLATIEENGKKVAIVGAGPAGLSAALELRKLGFAVTVFEKHGVMGGMMSLGVPAYRLPSAVIERDIQNILDYGVDVQLNSPVESEEDIQGFLDDGFESVFLSVGSHISATMRMKGEELDKVSHGIDFLRDVRLGNKTEVEGNTVVIGGGNVAMDCARTAIRLGAKKVSLVCLEEREKMPAYPWEVEWAVEEGVEIHAASTTKKIIDIDGKFVGLELLKVDKMEFVDGRLNLETIYGSESILSGRELIVAIGQRPDLGFLNEESKIDVTARGTIAVDEKTGMTSWAGVFAGGDTVRGAASVVQATADGQKAAKAIDAYIKGQEFIPEVDESPVVEFTAEELKQRKEKKIKRTEMGVIDLDKRMNTFDEVDVGFTEEQVKAEAGRCLYCAICSYCKQCEKVCEAGAICFDDKTKKRAIDVGAVILAPGFDLYDATKKGEYGYGRFKNVLNSMDYERVLSASGPFEGHIRRLSDGKEPKKIAFIQCIGSRDKENPYCSSVCCMYATKQAMITKEHLPNTECKVFVMDVRAFGKGFDEYYERAKDQYGVEYIYTRPSNVTQNFKTEDLSLQFTADGKEWVEEDFDMVVLGAGLCASEGAKNLVKACDIEVNDYNFALSAEFAQTLSSREGVYLAGAFESPKDIPESVTQASAAAAKAMELLADVRGSEAAPNNYPPEKETDGLEPRIGVFVCHCGSNIGGVIDCERVAGIAAQLDKVEFATHLLYTCSPDGLLSIKEKIEEHNLNRVVVASCTPRTHEPLFQETLKESGLNPYLFEMANIRDQCTWVHARLSGITEAKAIDLVAMAVGRAREIEALSSQTYIPKRSGLVVGGGVAGMTAALSIANQGFDVHLVEKTYRLGGESVNVKNTVEGYDPAKLVKGLEDKVVAHEKIKVYTNSTVKECKGFAGNFKTKVVVGNEAIEIEHGAAIIATGASESKPVEYMYGEDAKVVTQQALEEVIFDEPNKIKSINEVVMIQCVGSRQEGRMACSRVCCTEAIKNALSIKKLNPSANVAVLYRDIRTYGFKESYYNQAREAGVLFFRYDLDNKPVVSKDASGNIEVRVKDLNSMLELSFSPDILALSAAMVTGEDVVDVSAAFKVTLNLERFFLEAHMKLRPVDFSSDGLFLCGTCHSPKFIDESITQAQAAAAKAVSILSSDVMQISGVVSVVDGDACASCLTCVRTCPYNVPKINEDGVAEIEAAMCHGCGICAAECPAKAIQLMHYKDAQVIAKAKALFQKA